MNKEQKLHIANRIKEQRLEINKVIALSDSFKLRSDMMVIHAKLDDLEMYVRMLPVQETVDEEHDKAIPAGCYF